MKRSLFKLVFVCILLPPVCYAVTLQALEKYVRGKMIDALNAVMIRDYDALYSGQYTVKEEINRNIRRYLSRDHFQKAGFSIDVLVKSGDDQILYPVHLKDDFSGSDTAADPLPASPAAVNYVETAAENFSTIKKGIDLTVGVSLRRNSLLANGVLIFFVLSSALILQRGIRKRIRATESTEAEQRERSRRLAEQLQSTESRLQDAERKQQEYLSRITALRKDRESLSRDVDDLVDEIERLESGLEAQTRIKTEMETAAQSLRDELAQAKEKQSKSSKKKKPVENTGKRFKTLYKNLVFTQRAVEGFTGLSDEFQLKAEEVIFNLNTDDSTVPVRRKVFSKGNKTRAFEAAFAYSGRLYFRKEDGNRIRIIAIGTKNSQEKDLAYIESQD